MSDLAQFLPWHRSVAQQWLSNRERFSHAWLVHGLPGIGKRQFALAAAGSLLCEAPVQGMACGVCVACHWLLAGTHPDLKRIRPDALALEEGTDNRVPGDEGDIVVTATKTAPSREIRIEQLRTLGTWFNTATHRGGSRVTLIYPARAMNTITANALLKVLEEPPEHTVFILVADAPDRLLPTLVSRCRRLPLPIPNEDESVAWLDAQGVPDPKHWLAAAGGAPLLAYELSRAGDTPCPAWLLRLIDSLSASSSADIGPHADEIERQPPGTWIDALQRLLVDLMLAQAGLQPRYFPGMAKEISGLAQQSAPDALADTAKWLAQQRAIAGHPLNAKLLAHTTLQRVALACNGPAGYPA